MQWNAVQHRSNQNCGSVSQDGMHGTRAFYKLFVHSHRLQSELGLSVTDRHDLIVHGHVQMPTNAGQYLYV